MKIHVYYYGFLLVYIYITVYSPTCTNIRVFIHNYLGDKRMNQSTGVDNSLILN